MGNRACFSTYSNNRDHFPEQGMTHTASDASSKRGQPPTVHSSFFGLSSLISVQWKHVWKTSFDLIPLLPYHLISLHSLLSFGLPAFRIFAPSQPCTGLCARRAQKPGWEGWLHPRAILPHSANSRRLHQLVCRRFKPRPPLVYHWCLNVDVRSGPAPAY